MSVLKWFAHYRLLVTEPDMYFSSYLKLCIKAICSFMRCNYKAHGNEEYGNKPILDSLDCMITRLTAS